MRIKDIIKNTPNISIDSRTIKRGQVFIAVKGDKFDGHNFVARALQRGASAAIISRNVNTRPKDRPRLIRVKDTVKTLGEVARAHRLKFKIPVVAVTGSNGKTTTKDLLAHVLSVRYRVLKSEASFNNHIGLPLTLLKIRDRHEVVVLEMGMNHRGEIGRLSRMAVPDIGVITNIGPVHLKFLKTLKNVFNAKTELLKELKPGGTAVLNKDDIFLRNIKNPGCKKTYFGIYEKCTYRAKCLEEKRSSWSFTIAGNRRIHLSILGRHNIYNALAVIAAAKVLNIGLDAIKRRIESFRMRCPKRLDFKIVNGRRILDDTYNSNPASFQCAVDLLERFEVPGKKIVVMGDMLELGAKSRSLHLAAGEEIAGKNFGALITVGAFSRFVAAAARKSNMDFVRHASSHRNAAKILKSISKKGDLVLVKGSRGMRMEKIINAL
ncbi:MAG: UDP-N-acetylmuramoyl-tripeptide--D-alanyl-D-alanine ligase [Candidatus Omnitrophica bacterium]|nr:UDP-N-acetylmuramoyl-tripeptide--D-alanyl-D-alanine ligase [Candidatus Omnitrophota bacterium]